MKISRNPTQFTQIILMAIRAACASVFLRLLKRMWGIHSLDLKVPKGGGDCVPPLLNLKIPTWYEVKICTAMALDKLL